MNAAHKDDGTWVAHVQVRRQTDPELVEVIDRSPGSIEAHPDTKLLRDNLGILRRARPGTPGHGDPVLGGSYSLFTRVWIGAVPPVRIEPGYACVVGEEWDGSFRPHQRNLFVLDEAVGLGVDPSMALMPDLCTALAALKDIYMPSHEQQSNPSSVGGGDRRICINANDLMFVEELARPRWGVMGYLDDASDDELRHDHPFFVSRDRIGPVYPSPYAEDEELAIRTVEALFARNMLHYHACCEVLDQGQYRNPLRALGMVCLSMQTYDWIGNGPEVVTDDGYPVRPPTDKELRSRTQKDHLLRTLLYQAGDHHIRQAIEKEGAKGFQDIVQRLSDDQA